MSDYPSEETLKQIEKWDGKPDDLVRLIVQEWHWPERAKEVRPGVWTFSTGGWSGNESLISALYRSVVWHFLAWNSIYVQGGLLVIALSKEGKKEMEALHHYITEWAWRKP